MLPSGPQWIDPEDFDAWVAGSPPLAGLPNPSGTEPKISPEKMSEMLFEACDSGDHRMVSNLLARGANPNLRRATGSRETPVDAVFNSRSRCNLSALALIKAGGISGVQGWGDGGREFDAAAAKGPSGEFSSIELAAFKAKTHRNFLAEAVSWGNLRSASTILAPSESPEDLLRSCLAGGQFLLAAEAAKAGVEFNARAWNSASDFLDNNRSTNLFSQPMRFCWHGQLAGLIREHPSALASITQECVQSIYDLAVFCVDADLALALFGARLRPNPEWLVAPRIPSYEDFSTPAGASQAARLCVKTPAPLFWAAAACEDGQLFEKVKQCPAAIKAARSQQASPWLMAHCPLSRIVQAAALGIPIDGVDADGRSLTHVWAALDSSPRSGWATLAKLPSSPFFAKNNLGQTGFEAMISKMRNERERDAFQKSLSRIERTEIQKTMSASPAPAKAASKKQRL